LVGDTAQGAAPSRTQAEKRRCQERLGELSVDRPAIDADTVVRHGLVPLHDLPWLLENASIEGRKEFVRGITVRPTLVCWTFR
jgi:hypothetical protein